MPSDLEKAVEIPETFLEDPKPPQFVIYTTSRFACPYCVQAKAALTKLSYKFDERDVANPAILAELKERRPTARTVPQIFLVNGAYIGGCDDLLAMINQGSLNVFVTLNT